MKKRELTQERVLEHKRKDYPILRELLLATAENLGLPTQEVGRMFKKWITEIVKDYK